MKKSIALALIGMSVSAAVLGGPLEDTIRFRQSAYGFLGWNANKIKSQTGDHPETFNKDQVAAAADAIAAVAHSGLLELYVEGSDKGTGWKASRLKSEYFQKQAEVKDIEANFIKEADTLKEVAADGDPSAIKTQFGKVGATCKSCHDLVRVRE
jgi:cytochrome c556